MSKFKKGDLVCLSAAGSKLDQNWRYEGGFGIVKGESSSVGFPVAVHWFSRKKAIPSQEAYFKPYELKFFKADK